MEAFQCCTLKAGYGCTQPTHFNLSQVYVAIFFDSRRNVSQVQVTCSLAASHKLRCNKTKTKKLSTTIFTYWQGHTEQAHEK